MSDKNKPILVVLSGAGISAESGLKTFRDSDGLWEGHKIEEVATPEAWEENPKRVLDFYNMRRKDAWEAQPNAAHQTIAQMEQYFDLRVITQNVDNLHERAGSKNIIHLHGELNKARSTANPNLIYDLPKPDLNWGDTCELGSQLRPHIVWFGEAVPLIQPAADLVAQADCLLIIGTSLQVYPAAGLVQYFNPENPLFVVDPKPLPFIRSGQIKHIQDTAVKGIPAFRKAVLEYFSLRLLRKTQ